MVRIMRVLICDNEHGIGDVTFPSLNRNSAELIQYFIQPATAKELRKAAKEFGWGHVNGCDYCEMCIEDMR